mgnify:CR=1 FL=1
MEIRRATIEDIDIVAAVEKECFPPAEAAHGHPGFAAGQETQPMGPEGGRCLETHGHSLGRRAGMAGGPCACELGRAGVQAPGRL